MDIEDSGEAVRVLPRPRKRKFRHALRRAARNVVLWLGPPLLRALSRTWRLTVLGSENLEGALADHRGHFMALWHGRMVIGLNYHRSRSWYALVSASQDGDILGGLLERFGYRLVRGSSRRGGAKAVREMLGVLGDGAVVIITPDGPRGPRHAMNPGITWLARASGFPIVPIGFACARAWHAPSWDRFTLPLPWTRVVMVYDRPVEVPREGGEPELAAASEAVREGLLRAERRGFELLEREPDW
jgi:lysophospholipid acyltransferase (LPLAT)-like uncharacterized protein